MKNKKNLVISLVLLMPVIAIGTTLAYSANLNETTSSPPYVAMNPFEFIEQCQANGGLVFSWDHGYGCDFPADYDVICDNSGMCGEGFVTESTPQGGELAGIFDVGLHTNFSNETDPPVVQSEQHRKTKNENNDKEQTFSNLKNKTAMRDYCDAKGGTFIEEPDRVGCDLGYGEIIWCTEAEPCNPEENEPPVENYQDGFGMMTPIDTTFLQLFILKPRNAPFSILTGSNQLYKTLEIQAAGGNSKIVVTPNNFGTFRLKSILGILEFEGVMINIEKLSYLLSNKDKQYSISQANAQAANIENTDIEPTEQAYLKVSSKQDMNCRCGPGTNYDYQTTFRTNTEATVLGKNTTGEWYFLELEGGAQCWVWGNGLLDTSYLTDVEQVSNFSSCSNESVVKEDKDDKKVIGDTKTPPPVNPSCIGPWCEDYIPPTTDTPPPYVE